MNRIRVTLTFDVEIGDEAAALQTATDFLNEFATEAIARGGWAEGDTASILASPRALASIVATAVMWRGSASVHGVRIDMVESTTNPLPDDDL